MMRQEVAGLEEEEEEEEVLEEEEEVLEVAELSSCMQRSKHASVCARTLGGRKRWRFGACARV